MGETEAKRSESVSTEEQVRYLKSLDSIRDRCNRVFELGLENKLSHFVLELGKLDTVVDLVIELIHRDYGKEKDVWKRIPPHGRWQHFGAQRMGSLIDELRTQAEITGERDEQRIKLEVARSLIDLIVVSVLLDAGAGSKWKFHEKESGQSVGRSEGLAIASLDMFRNSTFSSEYSDPFVVDDLALQELSLDDLIDGLQVSDANPLLGLDGRYQLLQKLGQVLSDQDVKYFGNGEGYTRPAFLLDYVTKHAIGNRVQIEVLWDVMMNGFGRIWPESRTKWNSHALGDVWICESLAKTRPKDPFEALVPFHKLSQWLTYSVMEPMAMFAGLGFVGVEKMTGLAEYRNGGLFLDLGVLSLKGATFNEGLDRARTDDPNADAPLFPVDHAAVVEWRALTVVLLDMVADRVRKRLGANADQLPLSKILEAGTWKAGREIASKRRPATGSPPMAIISDGTVF